MYVWLTTKSYLIVVGATYTRRCLTPYNINHLIWQLDGFCRFSNTGKSLTYSSSDGSPWTLNGMLRNFVDNLLIKREREWIFFCWNVRRTQRKDDTKMNTTLKGKISNNLKREVKITSTLPVCSRYFFFQFHLTPKSFKLIELVSWIICCCIHINMHQDIAPKVFERSASSASLSRSFTGNRWENT